MNHDEHRNHITQLEKYLDRSFDVVVPKSRLWSFHSYFPIEILNKISQIESVLGENTNYKLLVKTTKDDGGFFILSVNQSLTLYLVVSEDSPELLNLIRLTV